VLALATLTLTLGASASPVLFITPLWIALAG
jgi:hypothetical protein